MMTSYRMYTNFFLNKALLGGKLQFGVFAKNKAYEVARLTWRWEY